MGADPLGKKQMFLAMWKQLAVDCKVYPPEVLFKICNEPNMKPEIWNELQEAASQLNSPPRRTVVQKQNKSLTNIHWNVTEAEKQAGISG